MRGFRAKVDENQPEIVKALRAAGASVQSLSPVGKGCPDLLVGYKGYNYLLEVKWPLGTPSQQKLTPAQVTWHTQWCGEVVVVHSARHALLAIGAPHE